MQTQLARTKSYGGSVGCAHLLLTFGLTIFKVSARAGSSGFAN